MVSSFSGQGHAELSLIHHSPSKCSEIVNLSSDCWCGSVDDKIISESVVVFLPMILLKYIMQATQ